MLRFSGTGLTHVGLVRPGNQDSAYVGPALMLVADGVGGGAAGEVASATTAYAVAASVATRLASPVDPGGPAADPGLVLRDAVRVAQEQVLKGVTLDESREGMATTLTAVLAHDGRFALAHIGDSRGYVMRDDTLTRVTRDHTWVARAVDQGTLTEEEASIHPWRNVVLRSINGHPDKIADVLSLDLHVGDRVLLASDGLSDLVSEAEIETLMRRHDDDAAIAALTDAALQRGGRDNVTVVLGTVIDSEPVVADGQLLGAVRDPLNIADPAGVNGKSQAG